MKYVLFFACFLIFSSWASESQTFKLKNGSVSFVVPEKWQAAKKLFGVQLMFLGPMEGTNRPVITLDSTEFKEFKFDTEALKKDQESYKKGREQWLSKYEGEAKEFFPYEMKKIMKGQAEAHILGYRYVLGEAEFVERSHFIKCKANLYHLKMLYLFSEEAKYKKELDKLIDSFVCQ